MKNLFKLFVPVAAAAIALVSCQPKEEQIGNNPAGEVTIRVHATADNLKAGDQETKTYIDDTNTIIWGTGEYMKLAITAGENTTFANSSADCADSFNGQASATFEFSVTPDQANEYVYQGLYPASAAVASSNTNAANYKVNLPAIQNATASSYDPAAYIMVAKPETSTDVKTEWVASYCRATALNKITLKNFASSVSINRVKITVPTGKYLAGGRHINLSTDVADDVLGDIYAGGGRTETIEVKYATALTGTIMDVWFTSWGVEVAEGEDITIVAYTTDSKSYTKTITVPAGTTIKFQEGYLNTLGAKMENIAPETVTELQEGNYLILAKDGENYYAMKAETVSSDTRMASVDYSGSTSEYLGDADMIWSVSKSGNSFILENDGKYLGFTGSDNKAFWRAPGTDWTENEYLLDITWDADNSCYHVTLNSASTRKLERNAQNDWFAFYTSVQEGNIIFVPATVDNRTVVTLSFAEDAINKTTANYSEFTGQTATAAPSVSGITYAIDGDNIGTITAATGAVDLNGNTGTATVTASFAGDATYRPATASYTINVSNASGPQYNLVSAVADVVEGDYIITWDNTYYLRSGSESGSNPAVGTGITVAGGKITNTVSSDMVWHFSGNNTNGFTISDGTNILHSTNAAQGISITTNSTRKWTVSVDNTYGMLLHGDDGGSRYLAVYNSGSWRYYATGSSYTGTLRLYKLESAPDTRAEAGLSWSSENVNASIEDGDIIQFTAPTLSNTNGVTGITYESTETSVATVSAAGAVTVLAAGTTTIKAIFDGDTTYKPQTVTYTLTVTDNRTPVATTIADALGAPGTYEIPNVAVYAVKGNALILGDATGKIYAFKSSHGLSVGDVRTVSGNTIWYNSGDVYEFDAPTFSGSGTTTINHGSAVEFADNAATLQTETGFASTGSGAAHTAVYVHAIGDQSGRNITTSNGKVLYLSAAESATDGKTVEVYGYVYAYSASHTNFNFLATSIEEYVDPNAKSITALKSSISGVSADGVTNASESGVYSLTNASDSDVTVTPDGTVVTSASVSGGTLTYSVAANTGAARSGSVTLAVSGGNSIEITISQEKASGSTGGTMTIDFESAASTYSDWTFTNIQTQKTNSNVPAKDGSYFGTTTNDSGNAATASSIVTKSPIANPASLVFYITKQTTNTNASSVWKVSVSSNGSSWTQVGADQAAASGVTRGTWIEVSRDLSSYSNVYVKIEYAGSNAIRCIDKVELTYN